MPPSEKLRQEWEKAWEGQTFLHELALEEQPYSIVKDKISSWWLSRTVPKETLQDIVKEIKGNYAQHSENCTECLSEGEANCIMAQYIKGFNAAIDYSMHVVTRKLENN